MTNVTSTNPRAKWLRILPVVGVLLVGAGFLIGLFALVFAGIALVVATFIISRRAVREKLDAEQVDDAAPADRSGRSQ